MRKLVVVAVWLGMSVVVPLALAETESPAAAPELAAALTPDQRRVEREKRREAMKNMTPEQRTAMREARDQRLQTMSTDQRARFSSRRTMGGGASPGGAFGRRRGGR